MTTTVPTFVPSIVTGITSAVTSFKAPPPNKEAMFDFSVAGPLVGVLVSLVAVALGSQLTLIGDPATLPALPLGILRQSTLGGGIIEAILGSGALSIPSGAEGSDAVAGILVPLHPVAIAGFISLFVNALALLPIGSEYFVGLQWFMPLKRFSH
jgi:membrane-associated protease RseP (regulator of RpoE activity)